MNFDDLLRQWNGGVRQGAQTRLAKLMNLDRATVSRWVGGTLRPGERIRPKLARILGVTVDELMTSLPPLVYPSASSGAGYAAEGRGSALPVIGTITGDAFQLDDSVPASEFLPFAGMGSTFFALKIATDRLADLGRAGSYVCVRRQNWANPGDLILARSGEGIETLAGRWNGKTVEKLGGGAFGKENAAVLGVLIGVYKKL